MRAILLAVALGAMLCCGQTYRCDWSVVGIGGGEMAGTGYRCASTAGQTAAGIITGGGFQAFIGFWQIDVVTGVREQNYAPEGLPLVTRLYPVAPNPVLSHATFRYTLNAERRVLLQIHDLTGRVVRTLVNTSQQPGRYSLNWDCRDDYGRAVGNGVYFCKMAADSYRAQTKVVLAR